MSDDSELGVTVKLSTIYDIVLSLKPLPEQLAEHIRLASENDAVRDSRLNAHARRQDDLEERVTRIEAAREAEAKAAVEARATEGRRTPWTAITAIVISGLVALMGLVDRLTP